MRQGTKEGTSKVEVSIHAPREGCDKLSGEVEGHILAFQFTHPVRGATYALLLSVGSFRFQFTHPVRGATTLLEGYRPLNNVSIHAPREGCDACGALYGGARQHVSIHAPREGCDTAWDTEPLLDAGFQFTHPVRGATRLYKAVSYLYDVSIHAPREGCDSTRAVIARTKFRFQFTHPVRGATDFFL